MMRILNICVIIALISAASFVYKIKFDSTRQAERVAKMRGELQKERDVIAKLKADFAKVDSPMRIQGLAERLLPALTPMVTTQFDTFDRLPDRPAPAVAPPATNDPIGAMVAPLESTGSIAPPSRSAR